MIIACTKTVNYDVYMEVEVNDELIKSLIDYGVDFEFDELKNYLTDYNEWSELDIQDRIELWGVLEELHSDNPIIKVEHEFIPFTGEDALDVTLDNKSYLIEPRVM